LKRSLIGAIACGNNRAAATNVAAERTAANYNFGNIHAMRYIVAD
jgi:hypothetical protein